MVQTRSKANVSPVAENESNSDKVIHRVSKPDLTQWLAQYPEMSWDLLEVMKGWDMAFEPSHEGLIQHFGGEIFAPTFRNPAEFWSESRQEVLTKWICDDILRRCKGKQNPNLHVAFYGVRIDEINESLAKEVAAELVRSYQEGIPRWDFQILPRRIPRIDRTKRYPSFVTDSKIILKKATTVFLQSSGSESGLHTDPGQGGALSFGVKLWAFFPPTERNMEVMGEYHKLLNLPTDEQESNRRKFWHDPCHRLEDGVWLTQSPGELLYTPSAAPHAVFTFTWAHMVTAHVDTAVTFVRNLKWLAIELEVTEDVERIYTCLNSITPERMGKELFRKLRDGIAENWPGIENAVREKATEAEWKEIQHAMAKMFKDVRDEDRPDFRTWKKSVVKGSKKRKGEELGSDRSKLVKRR